MHVFVVDDEPALREMLASALREDGASVAEASGGAELIRRIEEGPPVDLVITDVNMPGMDGLALLSHLRRFWPRIPVILMSAFAGTRLRDRAAQAGPAAAILTKPFRLDELRALVARLGQAMSPLPT